MGVSEDNHLIHGTEEFKEELKTRQRESKLENMRANDVKKYVERERERGSYL